MKESNFIGSSDQAKLFVRQKRAEGGRSFDRMAGLLKDEPPVGLAFHFRRRGFSTMSVLILNDRLLPCLLRYNHPSGQ